MAIQALYIEPFLSQSQNCLLLDVRSPSEYNHAHIPGALSLPLFDDEERKAVGTSYKQVSREEAIKLGLDFFGPKMRKMVEQVEQLLENDASKKVAVHCWRGGMRSAAVAWLLDLYGFDVFLLKGGYKAYRNWVLQQFEKSYHLRILSGYTGSGKTEILHALERMGEGVIDLEEMAAHRGSTFGALGQGEQPSNEYFENLLAQRLTELTSQNQKRLIWVESESSRLGHDRINFRFHQQMKAAECVHIEVAKEHRLKKIIKEYACFDKQELKAGVERLKKRLGGLVTKQAKEAIEIGDFSNAFSLLIDYYDRAYNGSEMFQTPFIDVFLEGINAEQNAQQIIKEIQEQNGRPND